MVTSTRTSAVTLEQAKLQGDELIQTPIGDIKLVHNYFDDEASRRLFDELDYQRAVQAYIWSQPLVSMANWCYCQGKAFGVSGTNDFVVLKSLREKRGILTANLITPYIFNFNSLTEGPLLIDYPAGKTAGGILDFWQRPMADLGLTGPDQGNGGRYIIVGPEDDPKKYDNSGMFLFQCATNNVAVLLRNLDPDPAFYEKFKATIKMGRLGKTLEKCRFIEDRDVEWDATGCHRTPRNGVLAYPFVDHQRGTGPRGRQSVDRDAAAARY